MRGVVAADAKGQGKGNPSGPHASISSQFAVHFRDQLQARTTRCARVQGPSGVSPHAQSVAAGSNKFSDSTPGGDLMLPAAALRSQQSTAPGRPCRLRRELWRRSYIAPPEKKEHGHLHGNGENRDGQSRGRWPSRHHPPCHPLRRSIVLLRHDRFPTIGCYSPLLDIRSELARF